MQSTSAAPARPEEHAHTIRSYTRRGTRLNAGQQNAWDRHASSYVIPIEAQTADGFRLTDAFERKAPLVVEIGFGVGESLVPLATERPECNVVGFEVWQPGVAECLVGIAAGDAINARLSTLDAAWCFEHIVDSDSISELWTFFPDPWPKSRHHKRRLISPAFAALAASRLAPGAVWRLATDWPNYAEQMQEVLDAVPSLDGGVTERYDARPLTRFERRGISADRPIIDLAYARAR